MDSDHIIQEFEFELTRLDIATRTAWWINSTECGRRFVNRSTVRSSFLVLIAIMFIAYLNLIFGLAFGLLVVIAILIRGRGSVVAVFRSILIRRITNKAEKIRHRRCIFVSFRVGGFLVNVKGDREEWRNWDTIHHIYGQENGLFITGDNEYLLYIPSRVFYGREEIEALCRMIQDMVAGACHASKPH